MITRYLIVTNNYYFYYGLALHILEKNNNKADKIKNITPYEFLHYILKGGNDDDLIISAPDTTMLVTSALKMSSLYLPDELPTQLSALNEAHSLYCPQSEVIPIQHLKRRHGVYFTATEREILVYLASGFTLSSIARLTKRSVKTISTHKKNLKNKLDCTSNLELLIIAKIYFSVTFSSNRIS